MNEQTRKWKQKLRSLLFFQRLTHPLFLLIWGLFWYVFSRFCWYGGVRKRLPVLGACGLFFLVWLFDWLRTWRGCKRNSVPEIFQGFALSGNEILLPGGQRVDYREIRRYRKKGTDLWIFLKKRRFLWLDLGELQEKDREYLELKLTQSGIFATGFWRFPVLILLIIVTGFGAYSVGKSAVHFNGKLSWALYKMEKYRSVTLKHDNIYEDGLEGILADIRTKVDLPEKLCLSTGFNLHFAPDGTVESLDTMLWGFDEQGEFADSYLITYDRDKSKKIGIWLEGTGSASFKPEKDFTPLREALQAIPLRETVADWNEEVYGILYYGERSWGYNDDGIRYIDREGTVSYPPELIDREIIGYSVSIFCPENEAVTPVRYLYRGML